MALGIAESVLAPGGSFLAKVSRGGEEKQFKERLVDLFKVRRHCVRWLRACVCGGACACAVVRVRACACVRLSYGQPLRWQEVVSVKPDASRSDSAEIYFLGKGFGAGKKPPPSS